MYLDDLVLEVSIFEDFKRVKADFSNRILAFAVFWVISITNGFKYEQLGSLVEKTFSRRLIKDSDGQICF